MNLDLILDRCHSVEFKEMNAMVAEDLMDTILDAVVGKYVERASEDPAEWEKFYLPAIRYGIFRRLAVSCREAEEGWYTVFCNNLREEKGEQ